MTTSSPSDGRLRTASSAAHEAANNSSSYPSLDASAILPPTTRFAPSRDPSQTRARALSAASAQNASPRGPGSTAQGPSSQSQLHQDGGLERKPSQSYGHHRQTSIVHGLPHSRNASLLSSVHTSPMSPPRATAATSAAAMSDSTMSHIAGDLAKSPSLSALPVNASNGSVLSMNRSFDNAATHRRPERMHSGRLKRSHEHKRSLSRSHGQQPAGHETPATVGEYALHHLFTNFIAVANERIELCISKAGEREPPVEAFFGPGVDPAFDQLISSLGHINRHKPKSLIDAMIRWRKAKADVANEMAREIAALKEAAGSTQHPTMNGHFATSTSPSTGPDIALLESKLTIADRRSSVSIFILCRVLIEAISQTTLAALSGLDTEPHTAARLEEVIYSQMQGADPDSLNASTLRKANWTIRSQLLGVMSRIRFEAIVGRYMRDIETTHSMLSLKGVVDPKLAQKASWLLHSMRFLQIPLQPEMAWEHACGVLLMLGRCFAEVHGRTMKYAYTVLFERLLLGFAGRATVELSNPKWREVLSMIQPKISQMLSKADHWMQVFPVHAVLLCVSPPDQFASQWLTLAVSSQGRAKDRAGRSHVLKAICRLVWRYLYRHEETPHVVIKRLEELVRMIFQSGKRVLISTDPLIADPLIQLIRFIGYKHQDLCFRMIIFPLMNAELFSGPESQLKIDNLDPERTVIAIRAFLAIMADLESGKPPPFPTEFECDALLDPTSRMPIAHRRTKSQGFAVSAGRTDRLSQPVLTANFNEIAKEYYVKFCKILGQLTIICDNTFGGQAVLDEKISTHTPKTPMAEAFTFNKRDDVANAADPRQHYYDLFHVAVEALPRCLSPHVPIHALVNLLCTGTAHVQSHIASSSVQSLKSIARQSHAQQVTIGFARFIFNFDDRYATTVSDSSLLGPGHIEGTLKLYVELLHIWLEEIRGKIQTSEPNIGDGESRPRQLPLDQLSILALVDEVESHALFFLCSPATTVRGIALTILRLVTEFDTALGQPGPRIIKIIDGSEGFQLRYEDDKLTTAERSRLRQGSDKSGVKSILPELCSSDVRHDIALWFKLFPLLIESCAQQCFNVAALTRELVCQRLSHSYRLIAALADGNRQVHPAGLEQNMPPGRPGTRFNSTLPEVIIEQWKIHLMFACITVTNTASGTQPPKSSHGPQHSRKSSKSSSASQEKIASASDLFGKAVPFVAAHNHAVRNAAVLGLGATNATLYPLLLQMLQSFVMDCTNEIKERMTHARHMSSPRRTRRLDYLRTDLTHLLSLTCHHIKLDPSQTTVEDDYALTYLLDYSKYLRFYLNDNDTQGDLDLQKCRTHFCAMVETLYGCVRPLKDSIRYMSFASRQALFSLMENWCGFSPNEKQLRQHEERLRRSVLELEPDVRRQGIINSAMEKERIELQNAALSAMASLCAGPLSFVAEGRILNQFDVRRMLAWIALIFDTASDVNHANGRRALKNLILHNVEQPTLLYQIIRKCYTTKHPKALSSYFAVLSEVLGVPDVSKKNEDRETGGKDEQSSDIKDATPTNSVVVNNPPPTSPTATITSNGTGGDAAEHARQLSSDAYAVAIATVAAGVPYWRIVSLVLHVLSSENTQLRTTATRLLRVVEQRQIPTANIQDVEISILDRTTSVYKLAQFELSQELAKVHSNHALHLLSEMCGTFGELQSDQQRSMVSVMLPWIQTVELEEYAGGRLTPQSCVLLVNLFEITVKHSVALHHEVQALWESLAGAFMGGNVRLILSFLIDLCLERREQNFVVYAKQIVVFLSNTAAGSQIIDHLLLALGPRNMVCEQRQPLFDPSTATGLAYVADLELIVPSGSKQNGMSLAQLCMVLLVDLVVSPQVLSAEYVPTLLHMAIVQWDQPLQVVQAQAREMVVHLIHQLVLSKIDPASRNITKKEAESLIESIRSQRPDIAWNHTDMKLGSGSTNDSAVVPEMADMVANLVKIFSIVDPGIREAWARVAVEWATSCAVQHTACRSLQVFRCLHPPIDRMMLNHMLHRLAKSIADPETSTYPMFSMELMTTLRTAAKDIPKDKFVQYPELFWVACACLDSTSEIEFQEGMSMMELLVDKLDLVDPNVVSIISGSQPSTWDGFFHGVHALLNKGVRSRQAVDATIRLMERLASLRTGYLVGSRDNLLYTVLANLPRYLHSFDSQRADPSCLESARLLASVADRDKEEQMARVLHGFVNGKYRKEEDFLSQYIAAIQTTYFPLHELGSLVFLMGMVNNQCAWFKVKTMHALRVLISTIDMRNPDIASQGPDLISPLLRVLHTEHCQLALDVLDNVLDMAGSSLDPKHLRMSMAGSHSSRATRKEYESTKSLYGIPEESGWSVPMPAVRAEKTRRNVLAIAESLDIAEWNATGETTPTPEVEFQDAQAPDSYFGDMTGQQAREGKTEVNMGDLALKLASLDDFFDDWDDEDTLPAHEPHGDAFTTGFVDERENLYDQQALPILRRSLGRNPSVASFQTGFNDSFYPPPPEVNIMNPMAFVHNGINSPVRPGLHNRSATSPVMPTTASIHNSAQHMVPFDMQYASDVLDELDIDFFSDDDTTTSHNNMLTLERARTNEENSPLQTVRPAGFKAGFRQGLRRLTSTGAAARAEAREAVRGNNAAAAATTTTARSPKVPKVPATFLNQNQSGSGSSEP